jgi:hypothetical protein
MIILKLKKTKKLNKKAKNFLKNKRELLSNGWEQVAELKYGSWCLFEKDNNN